MPANSGGKAASNTMLRATSQRTGAAMATVTTMRTASRGSELRGGVFNIFSMFVLDGSRFWRIIFYK